MKICTTCGNVLSETEFYRDRKFSDGLKSHCKKCYAANRKNWPSSHGEKKKIYRLQYIERYGIDHLHELKRARDGNYKKRNPVKNCARVLAKNHSPIPQKCLIDGCECLGERHHISYKPNIYIWLCKRHHLETHSNF